MLQSQMLQQTVPAIEKQGLACCQLLVAVHNCRPGRYTHAHRLAGLGRNAPMFDWAESTH